MYFESREQAGQKLADQLVDMMGRERTVVMALSSGAVIVGEQIANRLDCPMSMILSEEIVLPREPVPIGGITSSGEFAYNSDYSSAQITEFVTEYHGFIEQDKLAKLRRLSSDVTSSDVFDRSLLAGSNIILVSDGLAGGFILNLAFDYLKPINHKKVIVATPFANVAAVDKIHVMADGIACLNVLDNYISTDHYYDDPATISRSEASERIESLFQKWLDSRYLSELDELRHSVAKKSSIFTK